MLNLWTAWIGILLGGLAGLTLGVFFHRESWLGGYGSWRRRMLRLGHISFFGLAFVNLAFAVTVGHATPLRAGSLLAMSSVLLVAAAVLMPATCFLAAWRRGLRHLFALPVIAFVGGVLVLLASGVLS